MKNRNQQQQTHTMTTEKPGLRRHGRLSLRSLSACLTWGALVATLLTGLPSRTHAANCAGTFSLDPTSGTWFDNTARVIRYSPDGTKVAVVSAYGSSGSLTVYDLPGMTKNTTLSRAIGSGDGAHMEWTNQGGLLLGRGWATGHLYISPTGTLTVLSGISTANIVDIYPVKGTTKTLILVGSYKVYALDDADTSTPTATQITGFSTTAGATQFSYADPAIAGTATRIYLSRGDSTGMASTIKAYDWSGNYITSGWTDIKLDYESTLNRGDGQVGDMNIRATDGMVFARIKSRAIDNGYWYPLSNLVIFNQNGVLAATDAFNRDDLSILSNTSNLEARITFDPAGNIYGNLHRRSLASTQVTDNVAPWPAGVVKFDPKGNIDFGFMRQVVRSYVSATGPLAESFDVNQQTGQIGIINTANGATQEWIIDSAHSRHDVEQVEHSTGNWSNGSFNTIKYAYVHFWFNSGVLLRPNLDSATAAAMAADNCGIQPVTTISAADSAASTIDCAKTAFMPAPVAGQAQQLSVLVTLNVTKAGVFNPVTITGSGLTVPANFTITASTTGVQQFVVPVNYSGAALGSFDLTIGDAGTCTGSLASSPTNNTKDAQIRIWTVDNCTYKLAGPVLK